MRKHLFLLILIGIFGACKQPDTGYQQFYRSELFREVQLARIFPDSKTFVDCNPKSPISEINALYLQESKTSNFDLRTFVMENFDLPETPATGFVADTSLTMEEHIRNLWPALIRNPDRYNPYSSLLPVPNPYIVPGGRFSETYYWDSYFTMEGLIASGMHDMAKNMIENFSFLIDSVGFVPNGNRNYFLGRSQPPFFAVMVDLLADGDPDVIVDYFPALLREYQFWMDGEGKLGANQRAYRRVVRMPDGEVLNRYWDDYPQPRPESYKEDWELAESVEGDPETLFRHIRAACESGWDFSSRWFPQGGSLREIKTAHIVPIDLNSLLYYLEVTLAKGFDRQGEIDQGKAHLDRAIARREAILKYLWDENEGYFVDLDWKTNTSTGVLSMAGAYPLFFQIALNSQAEAVAKVLSNQFLKPGGYVSTLNDTGEQWDSPNGWAPLQWIAFRGLKNYGYLDRAREGAERWVRLNRKVYKHTGKMVEKYNVMDTTLLAGGGEYPLQDGFGWSNGIAIKLIKELEKIEPVLEYSR